MTKLLDYFFAARPMLHLPIWSVYLVAHHEMSGSGPGWRAMGIPVAVSLMAAGAYYINQVYDFESDRLNDKLGFLQQGIASHRGFMVGFFGCSVLGFALGAAIDLRNALILVQLLILSYAYSGPPLRMKDRPWLGMTANAYAYGLLIAMLAIDTSRLAPSEWHLVAMPGYFFLCVAATHIVTTLLDRAGDRATGKRTVGIALGVRGSLALAAGLLIGSSALGWSLASPALFYLAGFSTLLALFTLAIPTERLILLTSKLPLLALTLIAGFWYPGYLAFVVVLVLATRAYYLKRFGIVYPRLA